jgi:hypothetical protein
MASPKIPLFGRAPPRFDEEFASIVRTELAHGPWLELGRAWLTGESSEAA